MKQPFVVAGPSGDLEPFFPAGPPRLNTFNGVISLLVTAGEGVVEIDGRPCALPPGTLLTVLPGHLLRAGQHTPQFCCLGVAFTFDFMADFPYLVQSYLSQKIETTPCISLTVEEQALLADCHASLAKQQQCAWQSSYREVLRALLFVFLARVSDIYASKPVTSVHTHREEIVEGFFRLLHEHFCHHRQVSYYAGRLCITSKYLAKVVKEVTSEPPAFWIADFTIKEAKALLRTSTLTVTQLSEKLNFPNSSFFARYFRRQTGVSPQHYRQQGDTGPDRL